MSRTQQQREIRFSCPLPDDELLFYRMSGVEQLSQPFQFDVELLSENGSINLDDVLGQSSAVTMEVPGGSPRYFRGIVAALMQDGMVGSLFRYRAVLRPWLWLLTRTADCRTFQQLSVPEIVEDVFRDKGFSDFKKSLSGSYAPLEFSVQYRESDFDFVSRLLESAGIYYFFTHDKAKHTLVLADSAASHEALSGYASISYFPQPNVRRNRGHIFDWSMQREIQTGKVTLTDFDFTKPKADLTSISTIARQHAQGQFEVFDYPSGAASSADGDASARARIESFQAAFQQSVAASNARVITAGGLFRLDGHPRDDQNVEYLITRARIDLQGDDYQGNGAPDEPFSCGFTAIPSIQTFRPARVTPRPILLGPQTAIVVGKQGEEIWTDQYARIKIQFHWDRRGKSDENSSCWVRVAQSWAGKKWGSLHIPRIGQEVVVEFLHGDPDQPIVTGSVYNADQMPPFQLPDEATKNGVRSRSTKSGTEKTFNEISFDDNLGKEQVLVLAERDFTRVVKNNESIKVGFDTMDAGDRSVEVYNDCLITLEKGSHKLIVKEKDDSVEVKQGNHSVKVEAGTSTIEAATSIELKVGSSSVKIEPGKITLASAEIVLQANAKIQIKGPMIQTTADGNLVLKGGLVQIN